MFILKIFVSMNICLFAFSLFANPPFSKKGRFDNQSFKRVAKVIKILNPQTFTKNNFFYVVLLTHVTHKRTHAFDYF